MKNLVLKLSQSSQENTCFGGPGRKLGKLGNLGNLEIFKSEFSILAVGQNRKVGNKKTRNNISDISGISEVSEFSIRHFFIFQEKVFSIF